MVLFSSPGRVEREANPLTSLPAQGLASLWRKAHQHLLLRILQERLVTDTQQLIDFPLVNTDRDWPSLSYWLRHCGSALRPSQGALKVLPGGLLLHVRIALRLAVAQAVDLPPDGWVMLFDRFCGDFHN